MQRLEVSGALRHTHKHTHTHTHIYIYIYIYIYFVRLQRVKEVDEYMFGGDVKDKAIRRNALRTPGVEAPDFKTVGT
jgi:hypothetical protein